MAIQLQTQMYPENLGLPLGGSQSQDWFMDNFNHSNNNNNNNFFFDELSFNFQQKQYLLHLHQQRQLLQQQQQQQYLLENLQNQSLSSLNCSEFLPSSKNFNNNSATTTTAISHEKPMNFSQGLAAQLEKQGQEMDRYILLQNEGLKVALEEQMKQQVGELWRKLEAKGKMMIQQKEKEIAKATERRRELEESMKKMEAEKEAWRRLALENESMVVSLNNRLEQVKEEAAACCLNGADDAQSCCDDNEFKETGEEGESGRMRMTMEKMKICRVCKCREASVLLLPCRHLCSCVACHGFVDACPVCNSVKKACIEALFS